MQNPQTALEDLHTLTRKMRTVFDALVRQKGLTLARARILGRLRTSGSGETQKALAEELEIEAATLVGLLDGLEQAGSIIRVAVEGDRRAKRVELTAEGQKQAAMVQDFILEFRGNVLEGIDHDDIETMRRVIARMQANLERLS
ncbi:MarR family winged helix-turn-helix transcriptional regulator [Rhizobium sp.]